MDDQARPVLLHKRSTAGNSNVKQKRDLPRRLDSHDELLDLDASDITIDKPAPLPLEFIPTTTTTTIDAIKHQITAPSNTYPALLVVVTPRAREDGLHRDAAKRAVVVTVTQTTTNPDLPPPEANNSGGELPLGIIIGSVLGGVFIAAAVVGGWIWWGKRLKKKHGRPPYARKGHSSYSSATRLTPAATATGRPSMEKPAGRPGASGSRGPQPATPSRQPSATSSSGSVPSRGSPAAAPARRLSQNPSVQPVSTPAAQSPAAPSIEVHSPASEPGSSTPGASGSGAAVVAGVPGSVGRTYTPQKSSPLARGAPKATPSARVNEWALPAPVPKSTSPPQAAQASLPTVTPSPPNPPPANPLPPAPVASPSNASSGSSGGAEAAYHLSPAAIAKRREAAGEQARSQESHLEAPSPPYTPYDGTTDRDNRVSTQSAMSAASQYSDDAYDGYTDQHGPVGLAYASDEQDPYQYPPQQAGAAYAQPYNQYPQQYGHQDGYQQQYNPYQGGYNYPQGAYPQGAYQQSPHQQPRRL